MKRLISMVLLVIIAISLLPLGTLIVSASAFTGGDGSLENPYQISTAEQLNAVRNDLDANYILINDIDLSKYNSWIPIGEHDKNFNGVFNGQNFKIYNMNIIENKSILPGGKYGLFSNLGEKGVIQNVTLKNIEIDIDKNNIDYQKEMSRSVYVGGIAGTGINISNCRIEGAINVINCSDAYVGGIVGTGRASDCINCAEIIVLSNKDARYKNDGDVFVGGIVGHSGTVNGKIKNCINYGDIQSVAGDYVYCGGISGEYGDIRNCVNYGNISGTTTNYVSYSGFSANCNVGGIVGATSSDATFDCANLGEVSALAEIGGSSCAGGIAGLCGYYGSGTIKNCYNLGEKIQAHRIEDKSTAGRIAGTLLENKTSGCYSIGTTLVNNEIPRENLTSNACNGETKSRDEIIELMAIDSMINIEYNVPENSPVLSSNSDIKITLGEQEWLTGWINGIYTKIPESDLTLISSNENILPIISQDSMCMSPITVGDECFSPISAFVKGVAPGTSTLTFYCQGEKLGSIDVTVEAVIAETISDETILKAEILNRNNQFDSYRNTIQSPAVVLNNALMNNSSQSWATAYMFTYELSKILSLSIPELEKFDMKSYYEAVLMDILENDNESVWTDFYSTWGNIYGGYNEDIVQKIIDEIPEFEKYKDTKLSKETDIEIVLDTIKDTKGEFKDIKIDFSLFDTFGFCYDTLTDNLAVIDEIYAYSAITQEKIDVLKAIQEETSNAELAKACESMIKRYQEVHSEVVAEVATSAARESLIATGKNILELSQSVTVDLFLQVAQTTSAAELVKSYSTGKIIMTGSRLATDLVINSTDISKNIFVIAAYSDIENEIKQVISSYETAFETNKTYDNAVKYIASADVFKAALLNSCDLYIKFVKDVESGTKGLEIAKGLILGEPKDILKNLWQVNAEYSEKIKQAEHIKSMIQTTDFYDTYGTDIVEYISHIVSATPSAWAQEYVDWAIANNLLPYDYLRGNYQNNITRAEFCTLLTFMIQEFTGKNIEELQGNLPYDPKLFSDSYYDYAYYMASLGIVNGVSETEFNPLGEITREEAAVMLYRAAKVAGCDVSAPATNLNGVSNWATDGVNFVVDRGIMNGTDVGFEPQGKYTKEQAITTFVRFIENLK